MVGQLNQGMEFPKRLRNVNYSYDQYPPQYPLQSLYGQYDPPFGVYFARSILSTHASYILPINWKGDSQDYVIRQQGREKDVEAGAAEEKQSIRGWYDELLLKKHDELFHPQRSPDLAATRRHRRGHRPRTVLTEWLTEEGSNGYDQSDDEFFQRECKFPCKDGRPVATSISGMDTGSDLEHCFSSRYIDEMGWGDRVEITGIIRNVQFRMKGCPLTFRRDFYVCPYLDDRSDVMFGKGFIRKNFHLLFKKMFEMADKARKFVGGIFSSKKETPDEKADADSLKLKQEAQAAERERVRMAIKTQEAKLKEEARKAQQSQSQ